MADQGTQTDAPAEGAAPEGNDQIGQLLEGFNTFRGEVTQRLSELEDGLYEPEPAEGEPEPFTFDANDFPAAPGQPGAAGAPTMPVGQPQQEGQPQEVPPEAAQILDQYIGNKLTTGLQAFEQRLTQAQTARERQTQLDAYADTLETKYDEFKDEATTKRLVDATAALAQELGQPALAGDPRLLERVLLSERAQAGAAGAGEQEVHLESGGAAAPSAPQGDVDAAQAIVNAAQKKRMF